MKIGMPQLTTMSGLLQPTTVGGVLQELSMRNQFIAMEDSMKDGMMNQ